MKMSFAAVVNALEILAVRVSFTLAIALTLPIARPGQAQTTDFKVGATVDGIGYDGTCGDYRVLEFAL